MKNFSLHLSNKNKQVVHKLPGKRTFFQLISKDPWVDWILIIVFSFFVSIVLIFLGAYVYTSSNNDLVSSASQNNNIEVTKHFDFSNLKNINAVFDARANQRLLLQQGYKVGSDPSLP